MEGRYNGSTGIFEVFDKNKWVEITENNWAEIKFFISLNFLIFFYRSADFYFKEKAIFELNRRIKLRADLKTLWSFFLKEERPLGDLAINEIFERSGKAYKLPEYLNR